MSAPVRDGVEIVLGFVATLRHAGVPASPERAQAMFTALGELDVLDPGDVFWAGRLTLCADPDDLARYDAAFDAYFGRSERPRVPEIPQRQDPRPGRAGADPGAPTDADQPGDGPPPLAVQASEREVLRHRDLAALTASERAALQRLFELLVPRLGRRRSRRQQHAPRGRVDLAATVRRMLRDGGEPSRLVHQRSRTKPRRLVLLIDVSGSMAQYADALLRFAHAATRAAPNGTDTFTLGTRLTRVTRELRQRDPDKALAAAGRAIPDWSGGTRLGESLQAFLDRWGQRGAARGAVVVLCSDGWERGDPSLLGEQMARLARLAHSVVWVNPHKGKDGYAPITAGMLAALPSIDHLVAGHTFASLEALVEVIADA